MALLGQPSGTRVPFAKSGLGFNFGSEQFWGRAARAPRSRKGSRRSSFGATHSTYHRGQVALMMRQLNAEPLAMDFHVFLVEGRRNPEEIEQKKSVG